MATITGGVGYGLYVLAKVSPFNNVVVLFSR